MRGAKAPEAAPITLCKPELRFSHEPIRSALAVFLRKIAADEDDLAGKHLCNRGGPPIEASQNVDKAVYRDRLEGRCRSQQ